MYSHSPRAFASTTFYREQRTKGSSLIEGSWYLRAVQQLLDRDFAEPRGIQDKFVIESNALNFRIHWVERVGPASKRMGSI
jgi:hypothetical protein